MSFRSSMVNAVVFLSSLGFSSAMCPAMLRISAPAAATLISGRNNPIPRM
jgi:hypothetical protein